MQAPANSIPWLTAMKAAKVLAWFAVAEFVVIVFLIVWHQLNPVKVMEPIYVHFTSEANMIAKIERVSDAIARRSVVIGAEARRFVMDRETVDKTTEAERYPRIFEMSDAALAKAFREAYGGTESLFKREGFKRQVRVLSDSALGDGIHQVEIETTDTDKNNPTPLVQEWIVTMTYEFRDEKKSYERGLLNPLGFVVTEYTISKRGKTK